jgi:hypothetical protein
MMCHRRKRKAPRGAIDSVFLSLAFLPSDLLRYRKIAPGAEHVELSAGRDVHAGLGIAE